MIGSTAVVTDSASVSASRCFGERMRARELGVAVGGDDEHAEAGQLASEVLKERQRRLVRPVQIVQDD